MISPTGSRMGSLQTDQGVAGGPGAGFWLEEQNGKGREMGVDVFFC